MVRKIEAACISYLHLHNHTPSHKKILEAYNNNNRLLFVTVSKGQEFGSGSTGKYQLRASQEVDWGFSHLKTCPELGGSPPRQLPPMSGRLLLVVDGVSQLLIRQAFPEGSLSVLWTWKLAFPRASLPVGQGRSHNAFCDLVSEVTHHPSHLLEGLHRPIPDSGWQGLHQVIKSGRKQSLGLSLGLATTFLDLI